MINNMREVIIELFSFILCRKYMVLDVQNIRKIMGMPSEALYLESGFDIGSLPGAKQDGSLIFGPTYDFLKDTLKEYYFEFQAEVKAAPRLKSYLAQRPTINKLRDSLIKRNNNIIEYDAPWKIVGKTFVDSLPDIG